MWPSLLKIWLKLQPILAILLIVIGLWGIVQAKIAYTREKALAELPGYGLTQRPNMPMRVKVDSVKIDQLINPAQIIDGNWQTFYNGVSYLTNSARPGENSNIVIYGHNTNAVFGQLKQAKIGDLIELESVDQVATYKIVTRSVVKPDAIEIALPTAKETLTLYTCIGLFDSHRLVLHAEPVSVYYRTTFSSQL